jgi:hypothetical protein
MLRKVQSTQRKIRQIELLLEVKDIDTDSDDTGDELIVVVKGPASNQIVSEDRRSEDTHSSGQDADLQFAISASNTGTAHIEIELKSPFDAQQPITLAQGSVNSTKVSNMGNGSSSDKIKVETNAAALVDGMKFSVLIVGSDISSKI